MLGIISAVGSIGTFFCRAAGADADREPRLAYRVHRLHRARARRCCRPRSSPASSTRSIRQRPGDRGRDAPTLRAVLREAARHRGYVTMSAAFFVCGLQLIFLTTHLPTYLALCGQDPMLSAKALATIGMFNVLGCYLMGWLGGRYPKHILLGLIYVLRSIALTVYFMVPATPTSTLVFAAVMGMMWLGVVPLTQGLVAQMFGLRYMATLVGPRLLQPPGRLVPRRLGRRAHLRRLRLLRCRLALRRGDRPHRRRRADADRRPPERRAASCARSRRDPSHRQESVEPLEARLALDGPQQVKRRVALRLAQHWLGRVAEFLPRSARRSSGCWESRGIDDLDVVAAAAGCPSPRRASPSSPDRPCRSRHRGGRGSSASAGAAPDRDKPPASNDATLIPPSTSARAKM